MNHYSNESGPQPYVGITGFKTEHDVLNIAAHSRMKGLLDADFYTTMFGFTCSNKRLANYEVGGRTSPALNSLRTLSDAVPTNGIGMIHYFTTNRDSLASEVIEVFTHNELYASGACRAVQLNHEWPDLSAIRTIKDSLPELDIVLQLPKRAMEGKSHSEIVEQCHSYDSLVSYVLIDPSGGKGIDIELESGIELFVELARTMSTSTVGLAGGLCAENVGMLLAPMVGSYNFGMVDFLPCVDAQGKLRKGNDLDHEATFKYLDSAHEGIYHLSMGGQGGIIDDY